MPVVAEEVDPAGADVDIFRSDEVDQDVGEGCEVIGLGRGSGACELRYQC